MYKHWVLLGLDEFFLLLLQYDQFYSWQYSLLWNLLSRALIQHSSFLLICFSIYFSILHIYLFICKCVSCRKHMVGSCFLSNLTSLPFNGVFRLLHLMWLLVSLSLSLMSLAISLFLSHVFASGFFLGGVGGEWMWFSEYHYFTFSCVIHVF